MYCNNCGARIPDNAAFCSSCGARVSSGTQPSVVQNQQQSQQTYQSDYQQNINSIEHTEYNMKWYKFLINFALFAGALLNVYSAFLYLTGYVYTSTEDLYAVYGSSFASIVYSLYPGLRILDIFYGIALAALGAFVIYTRFQLSSYKKVGPTYLLVSYGAGAIIAVIYVMVASAVIGESCFDSSTIISVVTPIIMIFVNRTYFKKRESLFVN